MTLPTPDLIRRVQQRVVRSGDGVGPESIARAVRAEGAGLLDDVHMLGLLRAVDDEISGAGPLTALLADPATTDVVVNGPRDVRVDRGRGWESAGVSFADEEAVSRLARRLATLAGVRLDDARPYADGRLPDGTRLHAVLPPLAADGTCLSLRVLRPAHYDFAALTDAGLFPGITAQVLRQILAARLAFLVSGGTGTGKTTLLGALLGQVDRGQRIVLVEDAEELLPEHPHVVRLVARGANVEGVGAIGMAELVRQALRMRPDRLVVGEVRGREILDLLSALSTGHEGGAGTVHANSAGSVPGRVAALATAAGAAPESVARQLEQAVQVVMHLHRSGGRREIAEIAVLYDGAAIPAIRNGLAVEPGAGRLRQVLAARGVRAAW